MFYRNYKGIWFNYEEERDCWVFSDTQEGYANKSVYSNGYRWDEGYNHFVEMLECCKTDLKPGKDPVH